MKQDKKKRERKPLSKKQKLLLCALLSVLLLAMIGWTLWQNTTVGLTEIVLQEEGLPYAFNGYRIAQVSDLHDSGLWEKTIQRLKEADPDMIVITGDLIDGRDPDLAVAEQFLREAIQIADCFYIPGNHESYLDADVYGRLLEILQGYNVMVLDDTKVRIHYNGAYISMAGRGWKEEADLDKLSDFDGYRILLAHQPEDFEDFAAAGFDLVLSGHTHGGQLRLPLLGALYAPDQGLFPKYDAGHYSLGESDLYISRGIGNSGIPFRFCNRPEVVVIELRCK